MFEIERFVEDCRGALSDDGGAKAVREVVARAVSQPGEILDALGEPKQAGLHNLYQSEDLTVLNIVWAPLMSLMPHDHNNIWAVSGIYTGREDNIFWRRRDTTIEAAGARALSTGDVAVLGRDVVHSVLNPIEKLTGALHVYGGDFFAPGRSEWDPEGLQQRPFDMERARRLFDEASARFR